MTNTDSRIAILLPDLRPGGAERINVYLANELVRRGYNVEMILVQKQGELLDHLSTKVKMLDLKAPRLRDSIFPLSSYLQRVHPKVVIAGMWPLPLIALSARVLSQSKTRVIAVEHTIWSHSALTQSTLGKYKVAGTMRLAYPALDARVAVSKGAADDLAKFARLPRHSVEVIYNPVVAPTRETKAPEIDTSAFEPWLSAKNKVLAVGTLKKEKDFSTLLTAFHHLRRRMDAHLLLLGEGEERPLLQQMVAELGLKDVVWMPGFIGNPRSLFHTADLFVSSSIVEGLSLVIIEALEQGTPVVSTDCPSGPREILEDGKHGTLVPMGDPEALARAMEEALIQEHDPEALQRRAQDFSVDKAVDAYLRLLFPEEQSQVGILLRMSMFILSKMHSIHT